MKKLATFLAFIAVLALIISLSCACPGQAYNWIRCPLNGHNYAVTAPMQWSQAETLALQQGLGGHLATVRSEAENTWIAETFGSTSYWIGLNRPAGLGTFVWASGEACSYTKWCPGNPSAGSSNLYVAMNECPTGGWGNVASAAGTQLRPGIMEVPLLAVETRTYNDLLLWGLNSSGQRSVPSPNYLSVSAAGDAVVAVRSDGRIDTWGGTGGAADYRHNVPGLPPVVTYVQVRCARTHVVALRSDGVVVAWGRNDEGQCEVPAGLTALWVAATDRGGVALVSSNSMVTWAGDPVSHHATYGNGPPPPSGISYVSVERDNISHALALRTDGIVVSLTTGPNPHWLTFPQQGQVVDRLYDSNFWISYRPFNIAYPVCHMGGANGLVHRAWFEGQYYFDTDLLIPPPLDCAFGVDHQLYVQPSGQILAFGDNRRRQCSVPPLPVGVTYAKVAAADGHSHAIRSDGKLVSWGSPSDVIAPRSDWVAAGEGHTVVLRGDLRIEAWGLNNLGQCLVPSIPLQNGSSYVHDVPRYIASGKWHTVAALRSGRILSWGGTPGTGVGNVPGLPTADWGWGEVSAGANFTVARSAQGYEVAAWGENAAGQCNVPSFAPLTCAQVAAGADHVAALLSDGSVITWGHYGGMANVPPLAPRTTYVEVASGAGFSLARRSDGVVVGWGSNSHGQLNVPALPAGLHYVSVKAGKLHGIAQRSDQTLVGWGDDTYQQLDVPRGNQGVVGFAAGSYHNVARVGGLATYTSLNTPGCSGSLPRTHLVPLSLPLAGSQFSVCLTNLPANAAIMFTGLANRNSVFGPLPLNMTPLGLTGCTLYVSPDVLEFVSGVGGSATYSIALPMTSAALLGYRIYQQALVVDPGVNGVGAVLSDAATLSVGNY